MPNPGVLLVNLGSPDSPSVKDVRRYLREFLMDERVLDVPYLVRWLLVHALILPFRPEKAVEAYRTIWRADGSPLVVISRQVQAALQRRLGLPVELGMRYQNPSVSGAIASLRSKGVKDLLLIPMFPHYAMSSYETAVERVKLVLAQVAPEISLTVQAPYYNHPEYIQALVEAAAEALNSDYDHLLFSFHGLPERHLLKTDPTSKHCLQVENCCDRPSPAHRTCYRAQCLKTMEAFAAKAGVRSCSVAFQSRLGREPWLQPYTHLELSRLAKTGIRKLLVICPSFVADCLETLEEIGLRGQRTFHQAGGQEFKLIPCLNDSPLWLSALEGMVARWQKALP